MSWRWAGGAFSTERRAGAGVADHEGVAAEPAGEVAGTPCGGVGTAAGDLGFVEHRFEPAVGDVDADGVAVFEQADEAVFRRLGGDVADAGAARAAGEAAVRDERDGFAEARAHDVGGGGEHFLHAGAAAGAFVADDHDVAGLDFSGEDAVARLFL